MSGVTTLSRTNVYRVACSSAFSVVCEYDREQVLEQRPLRWKVQHMGLPSVCVGGVTPLPNSLRI